MNRDEQTPIVPIGESIAFRRRASDIMSAALVSSGMQVGLGLSARPPRMAVDVSENEADIIVTADMPGIDMHDVGLMVEGNTLGIYGMCLPEPEAEGAQLLRHERASGVCSRHVVLPALVDENDMDASLKNGVLTVRLKKISKAPPRRRIQI